MRILAARGGAMGDFILTLPAISALALRGEVHLFAHPAHIPLAVAEGLSPGGRSIECAAAAGFFRPGPLDSGWRAWMASFDQVVSWLADGDGVFQQQVRDCGADFEQRIFRPSDVGSPAAIQLGGEAFYRMQSVRESIRTSRLALHPGSGSPRKNWPAASWVETLNALHQEGQADEILLVCGEAEMPALAEITGALRLPFKMALNLPLPELAHELAACRWFLGHDSGPAHLAAACGVPCALVFGPANPAVWAPQAPHVHWLKLTSPVEPGVPTVREWLSHLLATPCSALDASGV